MAVTPEGPELMDCNELDVVPFLSDTRSLLLLGHLCRSFHFIMWQMFSVGETSELQCSIPALQLQSHAVLTSACRCDLDASTCCSKISIRIDCAFPDVKVDSSISTNAHLYHQRCKLFNWASPMVRLLAFMFAKRSSGFDSSEHSFAFHVFQIVEIY